MTGSSHGPSSSDTLRMPSAQAFITARPVATDPVKATYQRERGAGAKRLRNGNEHLERCGRGNSSCTDLTDRSTSHLGQPVPATIYTIIHRARSGAAQTAPRTGSPHCASSNHARATARGSLRTERPKATPGRRDTWSERRCEDAALGNLRPAGRELVGLDPTVFALSESSA